MAKKISTWLENIVGIGEIAHCEQFLLILQCFQDLYFRHVNTRAYWGKELFLHNFK